MKKNVLYLTCLLLFSFLPLASPARVFFSRLLEKGASVFETAGWRRIYQAPMVLNGGRLDFSVHGCDEPFSQTIARLRAAFKSPEEDRLLENSDSAFVVNSTGGRVLRALAIALPDPQKSLVFSMTQSKSEFAKSSAVPDKSGSFGDSLLPSSILHSAIKNEDTGARLETRFSAAAPENAINEIAANLGRNGWKIVYPAGDPGAARRGFMVWQRSAELCIVSAGSAAEAGQFLHEKGTCVTILSKKLN